MIDSIAALPLACRSLLQIVSQRGRLKAYGFHEMDNSLKTALLDALVVACLASVLLFASAVSPVEQAFARPKLGNFMPKDLQSAAGDAGFASKEDAEAYLARALPNATANNPKYRGEAGALTQWVTKELTFTPSKNPNGVLVHMSEEVLEFRNGVRTSTGSHEVQFQIEDVAISELKDSTDLTEAGEQGQGIIFRCASGKCVAHKWNGVDSSADWTDLSIQEPTLRAKILSAFQALKRAVGGPSPT
jgi:hypothetical protein